jgi:hypothetical protein
MEQEPRPAGKPGELIHIPRTERWVIVFADSELAVSPPDRNEGFATREEAETAHLTLWNGDPQLEVRGLYWPGPPQ